MIPKKYILNIMIVDDKKENVTFLKNICRKLNQKLKLKLNIIVTHDGDLAVKHF